MKLVLAAYLPVLMLTACSESSSSENEASAAAEIPTHNYRVKEGSNYGYVGGLSDEDKAKGKAVAELNLFRYLGVKDGLHKIQQVEEDGTVLLTASCANPCEFMKLEVGGNVSRIEYNPDSLGGAVMQDALSGKLEVADAKKK